MYDFFIGKFAEITPTHIVINCGGVGYIANISLNSYEEFKLLQEGKVYVHLSVSENNMSFFGFSKQEERTLFRALISVSGVGPSTARMILSSQTTNEIMNAIIQGNLALLKAIKGIGPKTAQRLLIELQDKMSKMNMEIIPTQTHTGFVQNHEALLALEALGFNKNQAAKAVSKIMEKQSDLSVEAIIKLALKIL